MSLWDTIWAERKSEVLFVLGVVLPVIIDWVRHEFSNSRNVAEEDLMVRHLSEIEEIAEKWIYHKPFVFRELGDAKALLGRYVGIWFPLPDDYGATTDFFTPEFLAHIRKCKRTIARQGYKKAKRIIQKEVNPSSTRFLEWYIPWVILFTGVNALYHLSDWWFQ